MHPTHNTLSLKVRMESIALLQDRLSNGLDVLSQTKQAHWNVKGESFIALHKFFDEIHEAAEQWVDLTAERIVQLGGMAAGTASATASRTRIPEYPLTISDGAHHILALSKSLAYFGELIRTGSDEANETGDQDTADIFTEISRSVDKYLWMVEAHQQTGKVAHAKNVA